MSVLLPISSWPETGVWESLSPRSGSSAALAESLWEEVSSLLLLLVSRSGWMEAVVALVLLLSHVLLESSRKIKDLIFTLKITTKSKRQQSTWWLQDFITLLHVTQQSWSWRTMKGPVWEDTGEHCPTPPLKSCPSAHRLFIIPGTKQITSNSLEPKKNNQPNYCTQLRAHQIWKEWFWEKSAQNMKLIFSHFKSFQRSLLEMELKRFFT